MSKRYTRQELEQRLRDYFGRGPSQDAVFVPYMIKEFVDATVEAMRNRQETVTIPIELAAALACYLDSD
jgi:hypothetical protein